MIAKVKGTIDHITDRAIIVDVHGIGYLINVGENIIMNFSPGDEVHMWTHMAVRETSMELFGFVDYEEQQIFEMLISVSGIGPRSALGIIGMAAPSTLKKAIISGDITYLTKASGIGKKTAEKIVLELRDKIEKLSPLSAEESIGIHQDNDVLDALLVMGYTQQQVRDVMAALPDDIESVDDRIRFALQIINKK